MGNIGGFAQHNRGGAVFFGGKLNRPLHMVGLDPAPCHHKVKVDAGKHFGLGVGAFSIDVHPAIPHVLAGFF